MGISRTAMRKNWIDRHRGFSGATTQVQNWFRSLHSLAAVAYVAYGGPYLRANRRMGESRIWLWGHWRERPSSSLVFSGDQWYSDLNRCSFQLRWNASHLCPDLKYLLCNWSFPNHIFTSIFIDPYIWIRFSSQVAHGSWWRNHHWRPGTFGLFPSDMIHSCLI